MKQSPKKRKGGADSKLKAKYFSLTGFASPLPWGMGLIAGFLFLYLWLQSPGVGGGDAGDLVTAAALKGVAHPPGYPFYTFAGWLITRFSLEFSPAFMVGWLSSVPAALAVWLLYLTVRKLTEDNLVSLVTALAMGLNYLFWLQAEIQEVFSLHMFSQPD